MQESHINLTNASERLEDVDLTIEENVPMIVSALSEYRFVCKIPMLPKVVKGMKLTKLTP